MNNLYTSLGHTFKNPQLLITALTHKSHGHANNEKMEFLGDSILNFIAAELVYELWPTLSEGNMSRIRSTLVREETLVIIGNKHLLPQHMQMGKVKYRNDSAPLVSSVADAMEAIYAAIYMDSGVEKVRSIIRRDLMLLIEKKEISFKPDPKTSLQELLQSRKFPTPTYEMTIHDINRSWFEVRCNIPKLGISVIGNGNTRKAAEAKAAQAAILLVEAKIR